MFLRSVTAAPDAPLVDFLGRRLTYAAIADEAKSFASGLQARGIGKGGRVGLFLPNVPLYLSAYYGALIAGATVVNFPPMWDAGQLGRGLAETSPDVVVAADIRPMLAVLEQARGQSPFPTLVLGRLAAHLPFATAAARSLVPPARVRGEGETIAWRSFLRSEAPEPVAIDPLVDVAVIQYTSGTTGDPKAVRLSHQNLTANARQVEAVDPWHGKRDVMIGVLPLAGIFGNSTVLNRTVLDRGCIALLPTFDPRQVLKTIARTRATAMPGIPTMFQALLDEPSLGRSDLSSLRACISGGAPLPAPLKHAFEAVSGANLIEGYGLAEAAGVVSFNPLAEPQHDGTVGRPVPGTRWTLLDPETGSATVAMGEAGELAIAGPQVMLGYWDNGAADEQAFSGEWLRTGDYATLESDGFARIVDRKADVLNVGPERVFPSRIEAVLVTHEAVREAAVIGIPDAFRGESPKAFVVLKDDTLEDGESLRNWLNGRLPPQKRVVAIEVRQSLPRVAVGKLDRKALRAQEEARVRDLNRPG